MGGMGEVQSGEGYDTVLVFVELVVVLSCGCSGVGVGSSDHHHHQHSLWVVERGCRRRASCQQPSAVSASGSGLAILFEMGSRCCEYFGTDGVSGGACFAPGPVGCGELVHTAAVGGWLAGCECGSAVVFIYVSELS